MYTTHPTQCTFAKKSFTSDGVRRLKPLSLQMPISMLSAVICPSKPSFKVSIAVWIASSSSKSSLYLQREIKVSKDSSKGIIIHTQKHDQCMHGLSGLIMYGRYTTVVYTFYNICGVW